MYYNYYVTNGDSGEGVTYYDYSGSGSAKSYVIGIHSAAGSGYSAFSKIDNIFSDLDLENY